MRSICAPRGSPVHGPGTLDHLLLLLGMDIRMPVVDGLAATEALRARPGAPEVVVLTTFDADDHVLRALRAGAAGFLLSVPMVKTHVSDILTKLGLNNRVQIALLVHDAGLLDDQE